MGRSDAKINFCENWKILEYSEDVNMQFASDCAMEITNGLTDLHLLWDYPVTALSGFSEANILHNKGNKSVCLKRGPSASS